MSGAGKPRNVKRHPSSDSFFRPKKTKMKLERRLVPGYQRVLGQALLSYAFSDRIPAIQGFSEKQKD
jgi:hypothetical protein